MTESIETTQPNEQSRGLSRALFLDRDGVINHEIGFLHRSADVVWVEGIFALCRTAVGLGYKLVVVTNQSGIARGLYTQADFNALMDWMRTRFLAEQAPLDAVYCCPYHPKHGIGAYRCEHADRKPGPGMMLRAARDLPLDLTQSILVGDRCSDIAAANAAGLRQAFLLRGTEASSCPGRAIEIASLAEVQAWLTRQTPASGPNPLIP
jgi:D-glycero-D-manno-heptose 1,7-bisphosphate phosphatase